MSCRLAPTARRLLALFALLLACATAAAQPAKPTRILFIGNSLLASASIPARLEKLAGAMGRRATVDAVIVDDFGLEEHWRDGRALAAIRKGWDVVVLQQGPAIDAASQAGLREQAMRFADAIKAAGAKTAICMTWPPAERVR